VSGAGEAPQRSGRPRAGADPLGPLDKWLDGLSPTAVHITEVGRRLLLERGYEAVTIEGVALEANVDRETVRRLFASKAGLVHAIWDRLQIEQWDGLVERTRAYPPGDRLDAYLRGLGTLLADPRIAIATAEVASHGLRDAAIRPRLAADYDIVRASTVEVTGLAELAGRDEPRVRVLVSMIVALIDGLGLQIAADSDAVDIDGFFALFADMVQLLLAVEGGAKDGV